MQRRKWSRGVVAALLLGALVLTLSGCSTNSLERKLRFGWPTGVTEQATRARVLWTWAGVSALALGVLVWSLIFWACLRYRKRAGGDELPRQTKYNLGIELTCVAIPFLIVVVLFWRTLVVQNYETKLSADPDVLVQVDAFRWNWQFEYLSYKAADGKKIQTVYPGQVDRTPGDGGKLLNLSTVGSNNEIPVLVLPVGESVQIVEHSDDVIHSFWVPEFLFKRDVIPYGTLQDQKASGLADNRFEFTATSTGSFVGRCAELCGTYHSQMNFEVRVVNPRTYADYLDALQKIGPTDPARQSKALIAAHVPGGGFATTTHPFATDRTDTSAVAAGTPLGG